MHIPSSHLGVSGHVHIKKISSDGKVNFESHFQNMVLDNFFTPPEDIINAAGSVGGIANTIFLGADVQTPPQPEDTALANEITFKRASQGALGAQSGVFILGTAIEDDYLVHRRVMEFTESEANGNLTEVGLGYSNAANQRCLCFKTLIKDAQGTAIVVAKTSDERLIVGYEFRIYRPPVLQVSEPFTFNGESFRFASTVFFNKDWITNQIPANAWDFNELRGVRSGGLRVDFFSRLTGDVAISYNNHQAVMTGPRNGSREMVLPPVAEERPVYPLLVLRGPCSAVLETHMIINAVAISGGIPTLGGVFCNEWVQGSNATELRTMAVMGVILDSDTLIPKAMTLPENHRLKFTTNPAHIQLLTRR